MLNIHDLEKRWKIYKIKSLLPYILIAIGLLIIVPIAYSLYTNIQTVNPSKKDITPAKAHTPVTSIPKKTKPIAVTISKPDVTVKSIQATPKSDEALDSAQTLKPSMNFMKNIQYQAIQPQYNQQKYSQEHIQNIQPKVKKIRKVVKPTVPQEVIEEITTEITPVKKEEKSAISIERKETQNDIFEIISRFKKNNNPALSLFIAKKYYELGNYEQSYNYALITNQINSNIEASWLIFARSLVKLHKKDKAIHTLQEYIKVSHSSNAEILLNEIKSGKFE